MLVTSHVVVLILLSVFKSPELDVLSSNYRRLAALGQRYYLECKIYSRIIQELYLDKERYLIEIKTLNVMTFVLNYLQLLNEFWSVLAFAIVLVASW